MEENRHVTISILPNEVISMILRYNDIHDIKQFGVTSRRFYDLVKNNQVLWREKFEAIIPKDLFSVIEKHSNGDWFYELKGHYRHKNAIFAELASISKLKQTNDKTKIIERHNEEYSLKHVRRVILMALTSNYSFFYTVYILQTSINNQEKANLRELKDYEITYARYCLRYLIHLYLALKWVAGDEHIRNDLTPVIVVNYFQQWLDTDKLYPEEVIELEIREMVRKVNLIIQAKFPSKYSGDVNESLIKGKITERQILEAISILIYQDMQIKVTGNATLENLNICNVLHNKFGNVVVVAAIYQTVAARCGVQCKLITFPNHLFLEWKDVRQNTDYTIDLTCGNLQVKRRCPFSQYSENTKNNRYCPDSLLLYIYSSYLMSNQNYNWNTQNCSHLVDFLGMGSQEDNSYRHFLPFLLDMNLVPFLQPELSMLYLSETQLHILTSLAMVNSSD